MSHSTDRPQGRAGQTPDASAFQSRLAALADEVGLLLSRLLDDGALPQEHMRPARLVAAMRHAALNGGKRLRPFLTVEVASMFGVPRSQSLMTGAAIECIHCYSLVHDDLPAMDNDDLRRGKPTAHKAFDEATAILAGDALLTLAFDILARPQTHPDPGVRSELVLGLARAAGLGGMVGGQMLDLAAEGRFPDCPRPEDASAVGVLQAMKTGALIRFSCMAGVILGAADPAQRRAIEAYGAALGEAFQIADDLLDVTGDTATLGKAAHKDAAARKATLVAIYGPDKARERLDALVGEAVSALSAFGERAFFLAEAARFVANRRS